MSASVFPCRYPGCKNESAGKSLWCSEHRRPEPREDGRCLNTFCNLPISDNSPWCHGHTQRVDEREEMALLREVVKRAAFVAEHLLAMIDPQTWRDSGGDDGQGHYEGDYRAEQTAREIERWKESVSVSDDCIPTPTGNRS